MENIVEATTQARPRSSTGTIMVEDSSSAIIAVAKCIGAHAVVLLIVHTISVYVSSVVGFLVALLCKCFCCCY